LGKSYKLSIIFISNYLFKILHWEIHHRRPRDPINRRSAGYDTDRYDASNSEAMPWDQHKKDSNHEGPKTLRSTVNSLPT
jgi:hypothetical protein